MHSRSIRFILGTALLLTLPLTASAQSSRVEGMNVPGDYIKDYTAIYGWPSSINGVGNLIYGELGDVRVNPATGNPITLDRSVGAVLNNLWDGRFGTWGVHLREQSPALGQADAFSQANPGVGGGDPNTHTNESFDLMWGRKMGGTSLGLRLNRSFFKAEDELPGVTTTLEFNPVGIGGSGDPVNLARNIMGFSGGIGWDMNPETSVELAILWQNRSFEQVASPTNKYEDDGGANYMFQGRAMWKWNANTVVTPVFKWYSYDLSTKTTTAGTPTSTENTLKGWQAGLAGNWTVGSNDLFVLGVQFASNKLEQQYDLFNLVGTILPGGPPASIGTYSDSLKVTETFSPNVFASLETHVSSWLTLRFGAQKGAFHSFKIEDDSRSHKLTINDSPFSMNVGAGVKLGTLMLDAVLDTFFPHNPAAQFVGGSNATYAGFVSFPKVTATYTF